MIELEHGMGGSGGLDCVGNWRAQLEAEKQREDPPRDTHGR